MQQLVITKLLQNAWHNELTIKPVILCLIFKIRSKVTNFRTDCNGGFSIQDFFFFFFSFACCGVAKIVSTCPRNNITKTTIITYTKIGMWKLSFFCGSGSRSAKNLPLPHRLFDLKSNLAKKFSPFSDVD